MTKKEAGKNIINYFEDHTELFNEAIEELDNYNGCLNDDRCYSMEELNDVYSDADAIDILQRAFFGYNGDYTDAEGRHLEAFNPNADYFYYNGYGNLVSTNYIDYSDHLDTWTIQEMAENRQHISTIESDPDLWDLFDAYEDADEDEK